MHLQQLTADHLDAVLAFETVNRDYFAATIPDRGDEFFADYPTRHAELLRLQAEGTDLFHLLLTNDGTIAGRVNLLCISDGSAELGYRVGRDFAGRGVATEGVRRVCVLADQDYGLARLQAETGIGNHASQKVLLRNGFTVVGETTSGLLFLRQRAGTSIVDR